VGGSLLGEAIARLRRGEVIRDAGYDGEYGTIRLFQPDELDEVALFSLAGVEKKNKDAGRAGSPAPTPGPRPTGAALDRRPPTSPAPFMLPRRPERCWTGWTRTSGRRPPRTDRC
jgi:hypothetical protein